jgi:hypothetical protein
MSARIQFLCPTCKAVMDAPVENAGHKINCLKCRQRLQIPPAERAKTILAAALSVYEDGDASPPVGNDPLIPTAQIAPALPAPLPPSAASAPQPTEPGQPNPTVSRSPSQAVAMFSKWIWGDRRFRLGAIAAAGLLTLGCICWLGITATSWVWPRVFGPMASVQGKEWSNKELIDHLHAKGLKFKTRIFSADEISLRDIPLNQRHLIEWETLVIAYPEREPNVETAFQSWGVKISTERPDLIRAMQAKDNSRLHEAIRGSGIIFFGRAKSSEKVKEQVRKATHELLVNDQAIHVWGLFIFVGDPDEIAKIKKTL